MSERKDTRTAKPNDDGADLKTRCFRILEDFARELSGEIVFPTSFDIVLQIRKVFGNREVTLHEVAQVVRMEPLIATKLLRIANSSAYNPGGQTITDIESALQRIGMNVARSVAMAVAMDQLRHSRALFGLDDISTRLWTHTLKTAVAARVLAKRLTRLNREDALLAGLVHDLGAFFMLYRLAQYPEFHDQPALAVDLIGQWHEGIGEALLSALGMPEHVIDAVRDHDQPRPPIAMPATLAEVVYVANLLAGGADAWRLPPEAAEAAAEAYRTPTYLDLADEIGADYDALASALAGH